MTSPENPLTTLTDEELSARHRETATEIERRHRMATIPEQMRELTAAWREDGGDVDDLIIAIQS